MYSRIRREGEGDESFFSGFFFMSELLEVGTKVKCRLIDIQEGK
jgi:hypothetical protein